MLRLLLFIACAFGISSASIAQSSENEVLFSVSGKTIFYLLPDTAQHSYSSITVWIKIDQSRNPDVPEFKSLYQWRVSCSARTIALLSYIDYDSSGKLIESYTFKSYEIETNPVAPGTTSESLFRAICT